MREVKKDTIDVLIRFYIKLGKTGESEDFKVLYNLFGEQKIREIAKRIWLEEKERSSKE